MLRPLRTNLYCCQQLLKANSVKLHSSRLSQPTNKQQAQINNSVRVFTDEANRFIFDQRKIYIVAFYSSREGEGRGGEGEWRKQHL